MTTKVTYGPGGFDPTKPNNNIIEETDETVEQTPLRDAAVLATLLATLGIIDVDNAAKASGVTTDQLVNEALAWSLFRDNG